MPGLPSAPGPPDPLPETPTRRVRVFLLAAHSTVRELLSNLLVTEGMEVAGAYASAQEAIHHLPRLRPDVAVLDVQVADGTGIEVCRRTRSSVPHLRYLLLSSYDDAAARRAAVLAGADGRVPRQIEANALVPAIRRVAQGESLVEARLRQETIRDLVIPASALVPGAEASWTMALDTVERRVLALAAEGLDDIQIGRWLGLAEETVTECFSSALAKLGFKPSRSQRP